MITIIATSYSNSIFFYLDINCNVYFIFNIFYEYFYMSYSEAKFTGGAQLAWIQFISRVSNTYSDISNLFLDMNNKQSGSKGSFVNKVSSTVAASLRKKICYKSKIVNVLLNLLFLKEWSFNWRSLLHLVKSVYPLDQLFGNS